MIISQICKKKKKGKEKKEGGGKRGKKCVKEGRMERGREEGKLGIVVNKDLLRTQRQEAREILEGIETRGP